MTLRKALKTGLPLRLPGETFRLLEEGARWFVETNPVYMHGDGWINPEYLLAYVRLEKRHLISKKWEVK